MYEGEVVDVQDLSGYREPNAEESEQLLKYLSKNFDDIMKFSVFGIVLLVVIGLLIILTNAGNSGSLVGFGVFIAMLVYARIYASSGKKMLGNPDWTVVDCKITEVRRLRKGKRAFYIETDLGQRCSKPFVEERSYWNVGDLVLLVKLEGFDYFLFRR